MFFGIKLTQIQNEEYQKKIDRNNSIRKEFKLKTQFIFNIILR